jgi:hypothetical protein
MILTALLVALQASAQDKSRITVKNSETANGVVLVTITESGKTLELQCNENHSFCAVPKPGHYQMVRLPKNRGMYDCKNVDLFVEAADVSSDEKIGAYCLIEQ